MKMYFVQIIKFSCIVIMILEWVKCNNSTSKATFALSFHIIVFIHYFLSILSWMSSLVSPFSVGEVKQILSSSLYFKNQDLQTKDEEKPERKCQPEKTSCKIHLFSRTKAGEWEFLATAG